MGRHKFRLSDMIPNAWFFKLRDMRARGGGSAPAASLRVPAVASAPRHGGGASWLPHRASHYYTPRAGDPVVPGSPLRHRHPKASDALFPPRRARRHHRHRRRSVKLAPSVSSSSSSGFASSPVSAAVCRCGRRPVTVAVEAPDTPPLCRRDRFVGYSDDDDEDLKKSATVVAVRAADGKLDDGKVITSATEIIIDLRSKSRPGKALRPIATKPARREDKHVDVVRNAAARRPAAPVPKPEQSKLVKPRRSVSSPSARRLKTRANTPRVSVSSTRKCKPPPPPLAESFAVVKSSRDPRRDFRESMEEMIAENGIRTAADLVDLLACYLALNGTEYHDLIVDVFEHIWATLSDIKM
jgi:uncharacterized protein (TIGR01568 family)